MSCRQISTLTAVWVATKGCDLWVTVSVSAYAYACTPVCVSVSDGQKQVHGVYEARRMQGDTITTSLPVGCNTHTHTQTHTVFPQLAHRPWTNQRDDVVREQMSVQSVTFTQKLFHNTSRFTLRSDRTPPQSVLWTDRGPWNNTMLPICTSTEAQDTRGAKRRKNVVQWSRSGSEPHVKRQERESPQVRFQQQSFSADLLPPPSLQCFHRRTNREKKTSNLSSFDFDWAAWLR